MDLLGITLWVSLSFGGAGPSSFDLGGSLALTAPVVDTIGRYGIAFPHLLLVDPISPETIRHELVHAAQYDAIGPGLWIGLLAGGGVGFEDYRGDGQMWIPPPEESRNCPFVRVEFGAARYLPCWRFAF